MAERRSEVIGLAAAQPVLVVSPHLDDAVFGCGQLGDAAGLAVVTIFAGSPPTYDTVTEWDTLAGFRPGDDVVAARRDEDTRALAILNARPIWLDFCDSQYHRSPTVPEIAHALERAIGECDLWAVFIPIGLFHSDHLLAHAAALDVLRHQPNRRWFAYEEAMYRKIPNIVAERIATLHGEGIAPTPAGISSACGYQAKRRAIACYASQLRALVAPKKPGHEDALTTERYWSLAPRGQAKQGATDAA